MLPSLQRCRHLHIFTSRLRSLAILALGPPLQKCLLSSFDRGDPCGSFVSPCGVPIVIRQPADARESPAPRTLGRVHGSSILRYTTYPNFMSTLRSPRRSPVEGPSHQPSRHQAALRSRTDTTVLKVLPSLRRLGQPFESDVSACDRRQRPDGILIPQHSRIRG
ncbi:hypothetical protein B0H19DRAFT_1132533 [Mycena capillaripes]|nr:hypothetical protein B0H19DRAFT_1132533 [Mycena capillaripes]